MSQALSAQSLLEALRPYYPLELTPGGLHYEASEEGQRLRQHIDSIRADTRAWSGFVQHVEAAFSGCEVSSALPSFYTPSFRCQVNLPGMRPRGERTEEDAVIGMLSALAPVYVLYARHWKDDRTERETWTRYPPVPAGFQAHEAKLATLMQSTFRATRLPNDVLFTRVSSLRSLRRLHREPWLAELLF